MSRANPVTSSSVTCHDFLCDFAQMPAMAATRSPANVRTSPWADQYAASIDVAESLEHVDRVVVAERGGDGPRLHERGQLGYGALVGVAPVSAGEDRIGLHELDRPAHRSVIAVDVADDEDARHDTPISSISVS
jgi:hypothetical protein